MTTLVYNLLREKLTNPADFKDHSESLAKSLIETYDSGTAIAILSLDQDDKIYETAIEMAGKLPNNSAITLARLKAFKEILDMPVAAISWLY
jgi:hypothetical protein